MKEENFIFVFETVNINKRNIKVELTTLQCQGYLHCINIEVPWLILQKYKCSL